MQRELEEEREEVSRVTDMLRKRETKAQNKANKENAGGNVHMIARWGEHTLVNETMCLNALSRRCLRSTTAAKQAIQRDGINTTKQKTNMDKTKAK